MPPRSRLVPVALLSAMVVPLLPPLMAIGPFVGWGLTAAALLAAAMRETSRRAALAGLATLGALVLFVLTGAGLAVGGLGEVMGPAAWEAWAMGTALASLFLPAGVYLATSGRDVAARVAAGGALALAAWIALFGVILLREARGAPIAGEGHIIVAGAGALAVVVALAWSVARSQLAREAQASP